MRRLALSVRHAALSPPVAPVAIGAGLAILAAAMFRPEVPAVSAMALVALGATGATLARFRGRPNVLPLMFVHLAVYGGLYALFVGASLHAAAPAHATVRFVTAADIAISICPLAIALRQVWCEMCAGLSAE